MTLSVKAARQKVFDASLAHLRKQRRRSLLAGRCAYRTESGTKCAIGVFISNRAYDTHLEGLNVDNPLVTNILPKFVQLTGIVFLSQLQFCLHDRLRHGNFSTELEHSAQNFASDWQLNYMSPT